MATATATKFQQPKLHHGYTRKQLKAMPDKDRRLNHPFFYPHITESMRGSMSYWRNGLMRSGPELRQYYFSQYMKCRGHYRDFVVNWKRYGLMPLPLP